MMKGATGFLKESWNGQNSRKDPGPVFKTIQAVHDAFWTIISM